jgi:hypothetical protein
MRKLSRPLTGLCLSGILTGFLLLSASVASANTASSSPEWRAKMRAMSLLLDELMADLSVTSRFEDPKLRSTIQKRADHLAELAHAIETDQSQDPSTRLYAQSLGEDATHGAAMLKAGHRAYARTLLRGVSASCVACHTRTPGLELSAPSGTPSASQAEALNALSPIERIQFLAASRRFDEAVQHAEAVLKDQALRARDPLTWEKGVRSGIAILVRVKEAPELALGWLNSLVSDPQTPEAFRIDAQSWTRSLKNWKQELARSAQKKGAAPSSEQDLWKQIVSLQKKARAEQAYPADRSADIDWMRTASLLTRFFKEYPKSAHLAEALHLQGVTEEALRSNETWALSENFYTACIRFSPHSATSRKCYRSLEEKVLLGWTGSAGVDIPDDIQGRLTELRKLSEPVTPSSPSPAAPKIP